ncbi:hypothetical protein ACM66B_002922 [Microbotryomycetes sp. NB124-2]
MAAPPKYLLTVIPPSHLPHDPPHPKSNPNCSGYGPPEHFKRGTLVPLQPTLPSQLAAIAREYGLPSTGGLVLYLLSTVDPWSASPAPLPGATGLEGGPRIGEEAWNMLWHSFFDDELDQLAFDEESQSEDDDEFPPVPPIPASLRRKKASEVGSSPTYGDMRDQCSRKSRTHEHHEGVLSDGAEELASGSSDLASGDVDTLVSDALNGSSRSRQNKSGNKHATKPSIGRGLPTGLPSPGPSRRGSVPARLSSYSHPNLRHASQPLPSGRVRHMSQGPSMRSFSAFSAYQRPSGPAHGAPVIVGKVEFDIDRRRGGKARWYEAWLESADGVVPPAASVAASPLPPSEPQFSSAVRDAAASQEHDAAALSVPRQDNAWSRDRAVEQALSPSRGLRPLELSRNASPAFADSQQAQDSMSPTSVAASGYSNTAMAGHDDEEEEDEQIASPLRSQAQPSEQSSVDNRRSRRLSYPSPHSLALDQQSSQRSSQSSIEMQQLSQDGYEQLADAEEESTPLVEHADRFSSSFAEDGPLANDNDTRQSTQSTSSRRSIHDDEPLGDVFPNDEATWRELKHESTNETGSDGVETTGPGIFGARTLGEANEIVREQTVEKGSLNEQVQAEDDVAEVMDLLKSRSAHDESANLASPIRLGSSTTDASETGRFDEDTPAHEAKASQQLFEAAPVADPRPLHIKTESLSSVRTNPLVSIDVRPPSSAYSSPEYMPQRKQRNGWAAVPPVVDKSMSASSSMQSIVSEAHTDSQRASTIGLMENLDDLERALADLSPSSSRRSPVMSEQTESMSPAAGEAPELPPSPLALSQAALALAPTAAAVAAAAAAPPPPPPPPAPAPEAESDREHVVVADIEEQRPMSPGLSSRPVFRYGQATSPARDASTPARDEATTSKDAAPASPVEIARPPRSASLRKPAIEPSQIALPPSPMPPQTEAAWQSSTSSFGVEPPLPPSGTPRQHRRPPPLPLATEEPVQQQPLSQRSPKSPGGGLKSLRPNKSWRKNKENDKVNVSDASFGSDSTTTMTQKSPALNTFFNKPAFQKLGGMFGKKSASESSPELEPPTEPDFVLPAELAPPPSPTVGIDHLQRELVGPDSAPPELPSKDEFLPPNGAVAVPESESELGALDDEAQEQREDRSTTPLRPEAGERDFVVPPPPPQSEFLDRLVPGSPFTAQFPSSASATSQDMQQRVSSSSYQSATSDLSGTATPVTPMETDFLAHQEQTMHVLATPKVPAAVARSHDHSYDVSSPRSEYDPRTPVQPYARLDSASSAPTTPAAWTKHLEPGSRFGSKRSKQQINDNIDLLLSQMSDIDFGPDEIESARPSNAPAEEIAVTSQHDDSTARTPEIEPATLRQQEGPARQAYPKSMDLIRLGDMMMTSPSPPSSPYSGIASPLASPPV